jgi:hypothetical protein
MLHNSTQRWVLAVGMVSVRRRSVVMHAACVRMELREMLAIKNLNVRSRTVLGTVFAFVEVAYVSLDLLEMDVRSELHARRVARVTKSALGKFFCLIF